MHTQRSAPIAAHQIQLRAMGSDALVHDEQRRKVHVLNASAARILELCDGTRGAEEIAREMSEQHGESRERMLRDVTAALDVFEQLALIEYDPL